MKPQTKAFTETAHTPAPAHPPTMREALESLMLVLDYAHDSVQPRGMVGRFLFGRPGEAFEHAAITEARAALAADPTPELVAALNGLLDDLPNWYQTRRPTEYKAARAALLKAEV